MCVLLCVIMCVILCVLMYVLMCTHHEYNTNSLFAYYISSLYLSIFSQLAATIKIPRRLNSYNKTLMRDIIGYWCVIISNIMNVLDIIEVSTNAVAYYQI